MVWTKSNHRQKEMNIFSIGSPWLQDYYNLTQKMKWMTTLVNYDVWVKWALVIDLRFFLFIYSYPHQQALSLTKKKSSIMFDIACNCVTLRRLIGNTSFSCHTASRYKIISILIVNYYNFKELQIGKWDAVWQRSIFKR